MTDTKKDVLILILGGKFVCPEKLGKTESQQKAFSEHKCLFYVIICLGQPDKILFS